MTRKVLIIEDSKSFSGVLKSMIEETHGFEVDVAETLAETIDILNTRGHEYFVTTVDLHLPDAPHGEALDIAINHKIPTIVFTSSSDIGLKQRLWDKGITDYASKFGTYNLNYVNWMIGRIYNNQFVEVLVVDDSLLDRKHVEALLKTQNFVVHTANSGTNALKVLDQHGNIQLAIIDSFMDGMDGQTLTKEIRERYDRENIEIIGFSAMHDRHIASQFIKSGADDFMHKPLIPEELLCRVNHAVDRIEHYHKLEALNNIKNLFIGTAAHDIRGPLGAIKTASDFLLKREHTPERTESMLNMINKSSVDLLSLLESLLDISVIESGHIQLTVKHLNFSETIQERIELYLNAAMDKAIQFKLSITPNLTVQADEIKIKQVIDNLITNAIKYSNSHGTITIHLESQLDDIVFSIQDNGPGIPEEEQAFLFQAFKVLSTKTTGGEKKTGLGLAISKNIMNAHQGSIAYKHDDETHSTFYFTLPRDLNSERE